MERVAGLRSVGPVRVTRPQALAWRMRRQLLEPVGTMSAEDVVRRLTAIPAQSDVELAVRTRQETSRPGEVDQAVRDGRLLRTFAFRGAVHLLTPEDGGAYLALRAAGRQWELPSWQEHYGLAPEAWPAFRSAVRDALDDHPLTPDELGGALDGAPGVHAPPVDIRDGSVDAAQGARVAGRPHLRPVARREGDVPAARQQPALGGAARPRGRRPARRHLLRAWVRSDDSRPPAVLARCRAERRPPPDPGAGSTTCATGSLPSTWRARRRSSWPRTSTSSSRLSRRTPSGCCPGTTSGCSAREPPTQTSCRRHTAAP